VVARANRRRCAVIENGWHSMSELTVAYKGGVPADVLDILPLGVLDDWEPADAGEPYVKVPGGERPAHYKGDMAALAR